MLYDDDEMLAGIGDNGPPEPIDDPEPETVDQPVTRTRGPPLLGEYYTLHDLAIELGVARRLVGDWCNLERDALPYVQIGRRRAVSIAVAREWLAARSKKMNQTKRKTKKTRTT